MHINGSCFCGAIEYKAEIDEDRIGLCHCRDCQIMSGRPFRMSSGTDPSKVQITKGTPAHFEKTADSGFVRRMSFCDKCGTHLFAEPLDKGEDGAFTSVRLATCDQFSQLKPIAELYCNSKVPWLPEFGGTLKFPKMPG